MSPTTPPPDKLQSREIGRAPLWVFARIEELAESWGGSFEAKKGRLELPVHAGLRTGFLVAEVEALVSRDGSKLRIKILEEHYLLDRVATAGLSIAAVAAVATLVLPFFPRAWVLLPPSLVLAIGSWLFIVARLKSRGLEDFLVELEKLASAPDSLPDDDNAQ